MVAFRRMTESLGIKTWWRSGGWWKAPGSRHGQRWGLGHGIAQADDGKHWALGSKYGGAQVGDGKHQAQDMVALRKMPESSRPKTCQFSIVCVALNTTQSTRQNAIQNTCQNTYEKIPMTNQRNASQNQ